MSEAITAERLDTTAEALVLVFADNELRIPWARASRLLANATDDERRHAELSPGGYGVHWPLLNHDLSVSGLAAAGHSS
jgi:hypothetical protein